MALQVGEGRVFQYGKHGVSRERVCDARTPCLCSHRTPLGGRESIPEGHGQGPVTPLPFLDEWMLEAFG